MKAPAYTLGSVIYLGIPTLFDTCQALLTMLHIARIHFMGFASSLDKVSLLHVGG